MTHPMDDTFDEDCWNCGEVHSGPCIEDDPNGIADRLDREEEEGTCINRDPGGAPAERCINPHYSHGRSECFTQQMAEDAMRDTEAEAGPPPEEGQRAR